MTIWIIVHVPKCGGMSLRRTLDAQAKDNDWLDLHLYSEPHLMPAGSNPHPREALSAKQWQDEIVPLLDGPFEGGKTHCILGHVPISRFLPWAGKPGIKFATIIRDPVERLLSHYYWWQAWPDKQHPVAQRLAEYGYSAVEFACQPEMKNVIAYFLGALPPDRWDCIGHLDGTEDGYSWHVYNLLAAMIGFLPPARPDHANRNDGRTIPTYPLSPEIKAAIREQNLHDYSLYSLLLDRHHEMMSRVAQQFRKES